MVATETGTVLAAQYRAEQLSIRAAFLTQVLAVQPLLDPQRLDETAPGWLAALMALIGRFRLQSAVSGENFYRRLRLTETASHSAPTAPGLDLPRMDRAARTSLTVLGPVGIKYRTGRGMRPTVAARDALVEVAGSAARHVLDGGRRAVSMSVVTDTDAVGWARVTDDDPCWFCAMMASRGPAYKTRNTAGRIANDKFVGPGLYKFHDHCACTVQPLFSADAPWPGRGREFQQLWTDSTADWSGRDKRIAFRRAYEGRPALEATVSR